MTQPAVSIADVRRQFPQYSDLDDRQLADGLHQRFYADMPRLEFDRKIGAPIEGIDWNRPVAAVRADVDKLPTEDRPRALRQWADSYVARERAAKRASGPHGNIEDVVRGVSRGTLVGPWLDELTALTEGGMHSATGGRFGSPYDESLEYQRAQDRAADLENPGTAIATQLAGGLASATPLVQGARTLVGRMARGTAVGGVHGFNYGAGTAEGDAGERLQAGVETAPLGAAFGAAFPLVAKGAGAAGNVIHDFASPTVARWGANLREIPRRIGISASADGAVPETAGARAAAEQMAADQLHRSGRTVDDLEQQLAGHERDRLFYPPRSRAADVVAPVDLDESLAALAGSAARASPEARGIGNAFMTARQTGATPAGRQLEPGAGLPTRPVMAPPITGAEALRLHGTSYDTPARNLVPMGQRERMSDALRRSLVIRDSEHHGHLPSAYRTQQKILAEGKKESDKLYGSFRLAAEGYDIRPRIQGIMDRTRARIADPNTGKTEAELLQRGLDEFHRKVPGGSVEDAMARIRAGVQGGSDATLVRSMRGFDEAKRALDAIIDNADNYGRKVLGDFRRDLLAEVDKIKDRNLGALYKQARASFVETRRADEAYLLGREAAREGSEIGADRYHALASDTERKLFRLGLWKHYDERMAGLKPTDNVTNIFKQRDDELLAQVIPRTTTPKRGRPTGEFGDRPERFARYRETERRMVTETSQIARGGSSTARNLADDEAYNVLGVIDHLRSINAVDAGLKAIGAMLNKMFGMQADAAASLSRQLFTANPIERAKVLRNIKMRMGRSRYEQFTRYMGDVQSSLIGVGARTVPQVGSE